MSEVDEFSGPIRVVLAEDNLLVREGINRLLQTRSEIQLMDSCASFDELINAIDKLEPHVVLTDIRMPPNRRDEGIQAAAYCRQHHPKMGVVLLSQYIEPTYLRLLLSEGAEGRGYLLKERVSDVDDLVLCIREVARGGSIIDPKVIETLVNVRAADAQSGLNTLTPRELQVLAAMAEGKNNAAIAAGLVLSQRAVEKHINSIFSKLGLGPDSGGHPRVRAVLLYLSEQHDVG